MLCEIPAGVGAYATPAPLVLAASLTRKVTRLDMRKKFRAEQAATYLSIAQMEEFAKWNHTVATSILSGISVDKGSHGI